MISYKLGISIKGSEPAIERIVSVPKDVTFRDLHNILQVAMGWEGGHLYEFIVGDDKVLIGPRRPDSDVRGMGNDVLIPLSKYEGAEISYVYDLSCEWVHELRFIGETDDLVPKVLEYFERCPPEGCGGVKGFARCNEVLKDPTDPGYPEVREWFDNHYLDYDVEYANNYLGNVWERFDPERVIDEKQYVAILGSLKDAEDCDLLFDPESKEVVKAKRGQTPDKEMIPLAFHDDPPVYRMLDEFLLFEENRALSRRVGAVRNPKMRYRKFMSLVVRDQKALRVWGGFLDDGLYHYVSRWATINGYEVELPQLSASDIESIFKKIGGSIMAMGDSARLEKDTYLCPDCGTPSKASLDHDGSPTALMGTYALPATLICDACGNETKLLKLNDGYHIGYHYDTWAHPCRMVESTLRKYLDMKAIVDDRERFLACADLIVPLWRLRMGPQADDCRSIMRGSMDPDDPVQVATMEVVDASFEVRDPSPSIKDRIPEMPRPIAVMGAFALEYMGRSFDEVEEMHSFANSVLDGWMPRDEEYFRLRAIELTCYTEDERPVDASREMVSLLKEALDHVSTEQKEFDGMHWEIGTIFEDFSMRLWELGFNDELNELCSVMGDYISRDDLQIPYSLKVIYWFRKGLLELTFGGGIDAAEPFLREAVSIYTTYLDSGLFTMTRVLPAASILYRYGRMAEDEFFKLLPMVDAFVGLNYHEHEDIAQCASYALYALMRDRSFEDAMAIYDDKVRSQLDIDESRIIDMWENPMCLWDMVFGSFIG